ncbi:hypothetical protein [Streptomyces sp. NRRL S-340]|uniref:hypothetical protein n=1 Tax=Streptomyces sp. NRRL S-340 TaxID=1463901 RepID=UPI00099C86E8|nr:hypothetical protein [Streptomyces sp. NRRL S-340]
MAGRGRVPGTMAAAASLLLASLTACGGHSATDTARDQVQRLLDSRAAAVLHHDPAAYATTGDRAPYTKLDAVPFTAWSYRVTALHRSGGRTTADADLSYRVTGYDTAPVTVGRTVTLSTTADGKWYVDSDRPARGFAQQLWDQGTVSVVRGRSSIVLGVGQSAGALRGYAGLADHAVPAVSDAWGTDWSRRVVVLVPGSLDGMAALLGSPADDYRGIAAVTTGEAGGGGRAPADRVVVNPDAYSLLGPLGRQVVLTHETTHVATRTHTDAATPLWLSEGYADWVGYRRSGRTPEQAAPELQHAVADGQVPAALPSDKDFGFAGDPTRLAQAYEGGWLACRMIAAHWGEDRLDAFYRAVGAHQRRAGAVEDALRTELGTTLQRFTGQWREYVRAQLG